MLRPTRTRRLSIAAVVSLLAALALAGAGVRSFWSTCELDFGRVRFIALKGGCVVYTHISGPLTQRISNKSGFISYSDPQPMDASTVLKFSVFHKTYGRSDYFSVRIPLWPLLLLLLIAPMRWLIARPEDTLAFPVVAKRR